MMQNAHISLKKKNIDGFMINWYKNFIFNCICLHTLRSPVEVLQKYTEYTDIYGVKVAVAPVVERVTY